MNYTLSIVNQAGTQQDLKSRQILKALGPSPEFQILLIKYYPANPYFQQIQKSFFIVIQTKQFQNQGHTQNHIKIKKIIEKKPLTKITIQNNNFSQTSELKQVQNNQIKQSQKLSQIQCRFQDKDKDSFDFQRIISGNFIQQNAFLVLQNPFQLYFLTSKQKNPIKIIFEETIQLQNVVAYFTFETNQPQKRKQPFLLIVYGFEQKANSNKMLTINLMTFDMKQVSQNNNYTPKYRKNNFRVFHEDRLYVFGGQSTNKKEIQNLLWSFDLQKGYWFALQMNQNEQNKNLSRSLSTIYDSGKVIILKSKKFLLMEAYQCKISQIDSQSIESIISQIKQCEIIGLLACQKRIYLYKKNGFLPFYLILQKANKPSRPLFKEQQKKEQKEQSKESDKEQRIQQRPKQNKEKSQ